MTKSWRTTALGLATIVAALATVAKALLDGDATTNPDWTTAAAAIGAGWGLLAARDNKVSSEGAGAK